MPQLFPVVAQGFRYYAGIGSRETPEELSRLIAEIADRLMTRGYVLRSGGAGGADTFFAQNIPEIMREIFLPWRGFRGVSDGIVVDSFENYERARHIAEKFHPAWDRCSQGARKLLTRNTYQVLGRGLDEPCSHIICWTKDGKHSGGTGQALRIADDYGIPIYNLRNEEDRLRVMEDLYIVPERF